MTGARGGVQEVSASVRTVHCVAQAGRFDARRVTAWAEMMGVRKAKKEAIVKDLIVSEGTRYERIGCTKWTTWSER